MSAEPRAETCPCALFARSTEWAALAAARWLGRDDQDAAEEAAEGAMLAGLSELPVSATIVIGSDEGGVLPSAPLWAPAARRSTSPSTRSRVAASSPAAARARCRCSRSGRLARSRLPDMYMRRMAVGPRALGRIDLTRPVGENVAAIAEAFGRNANDITALVLERPRHHDLIEEIRAAGARIKLIQDGDVTASISAAIRGTNDHLAIGIGGTRQAVLSAAALRCLGGELQAQLWPTTRSEIEAAAEQGVKDVNRVFSSEDLAPGDVIVVATGVSNGDLLRGVRFLADSARTLSLVMCMRCNWVRFAESIHFFTRERKEEVRLLG